MSRILVLAHSHPAITLGGGEVAAYREFEELRRRGADAVFVGMTNSAAAIGTLFRAGGRVVENGPSDFIVRCPPFDNFGYAFADILDEDAVVDILAAFEPDIVHAHHFWNIGAPTLRRLRALLPDAVFLLTLHEYQVICAADGQMLKRGSLEPCAASGPVACALCCGDHAPFDYLMRERAMRAMLAAFDLVLSPSAFLKERVVAWGLPAERIVVLENGLPPAPPATDPLPAAARAGRFAFFGQATPTKGLNVLVDAALHLEATAGRRLPIDVHGVTLERFRALWPDREIPKGMTFRGRYSPADAVALMRRFGWIVMPSIWWENSPVVIQEARAAGVPMIASRLGGVLEKTAGWSLHFNPGDAVDLARVMAEVAGDAARLEAMGARITPPLGIAPFVDSLLDLVRAARRAGPVQAPALEASV
jgi:glycosyltransferase involved in cell wall biosynthesis